MPNYYKYYRNVFIYEQGKISKLVHMLLRDRNNDDDVK